LQLLAINLL